jgi:hypothetical protein
MNQCLIEGCDRAAKSRGLCKSCYQAARAAVKAGKVSWDQLVLAGLAKETAPSKGQQSRFAAAMEKKILASRPRGSGAEVPAARSPQGGVTTPEPHPLCPAIGADVGAGDDTPQFGVAQQSKAAPAAGSPYPALDNASPLPHEPSAPVPQADQPPATPLPWEK